MAGPFPDQGLMGAGHHLDRLSPRAVAGDRSQLVSVGADHVRQHVRIGGVALGARNAQPVPEPGRLQRIDRQHRVPGGDQRRHPRPPVGLDPDHHLRILVRDLTELIADHRVRPGHPRHPLGQAGLGQPSPRAVHHLHIVVVLGPVISHKQPQRSSRSQPLCRSPSSSQRENHQRPNQAVLTPTSNGHDIPAAINSPDQPARARSLVRTQTSRTTECSPTGWLPTKEFAG